MRACAPHVMAQVTNERVMHVGVPALVGGLVFALFPFLASRSSVSGRAPQLLCCSFVRVFARLAAPRAGTSGRGRPKAALTRKPKSRSTSLCTRLLLAWRRWRALRACAWEWWA